MKFEDLPASVQEQINTQMLHEEPMITVVLKPEHVAQMHADDAQQRFDAEQARLAGVPLDFAQLYSKVEAEILSAIADRPQPPEIVTAAVIQLVTAYATSAVEGRLRDQGEEITRLQRMLDKQESQMRHTRGVYEQRGRDMDVMRAAIASMMERIQCAEYDVHDEKVVRLDKIVTVWPMPALKLTRIKIEDND